MMTQQTGTQLEEQANALLAQSMLRMGCGERRFYTEAGMDTVSQREHEAAEVLARLALDTGGDGQ